MARIPHHLQGSNQYYYRRYGWIDGQSIRGIDKCLEMLLHHVQMSVNLALTWAFFII